MFHFSLPLPLRCPHPLDRASATKIDRFATLSLWANRSCFLPKLHRGSHLPLSIRGAAGGFSFCGQPGVAPFSGGSGNAAGGMIMPPKGSTQRGCPPLGDSLVTFSSGRRVRQSLTPSPLEGRSACISGSAEGRQPLASVSSGLQGLFPVFLRCQNPLLLL